MPSVFEIERIFSVLQGASGQRVSPVIAWSCSGFCPERAIEGWQGILTQVHRNGQYGQIYLRPIGQDRAGFGNAMAVQEGREIAMAQPPIDQCAQPMFRYPEVLGQASNGQAGGAIEPLCHRDVEILTQHVFRSGKFGM